MGNFSIAGIYKTRGHHSRPSDAELTRRAEEFKQKETKKYATAIAHMGASMKALKADVEKRLSEKDKEALFNRKSSFGDYASVFLALSKNREAESLIHGGIAKGIAAAITEIMQKSTFERDVGHKGLEILSALLFNPRIRVSSLNEPKMREQLIHSVLAAVNKAERGYTFESGAVDEICSMYANPKVFPNAAANLVKTLINSEQDTHILDSAAHLVRMVSFPTENGIKQLNEALSKLAPKARLEVFHAVYSITWHHSNKKLEGVGQAALDIVTKHGKDSVKILAALEGQINHDTTQKQFQELAKQAVGQ